MMPAGRDRANASKAFATLRQVLAEIGWGSSPGDPEGVIAVGFPPHFPVSDALAAIAFESERFILYLNLARHAPVERREPVARLMNLINWQLSVGSFEMDVTDGHMRFRSSIEFANAPLHAQLIRNHILASMRAVETYIEAVLQVVEGRLEPVQAMARMAGERPRP